MSWPYDIKMDCFCHDGDKDCDICPFYYAYHTDDPIFNVIRGMEEEKNLAEEIKDREEQRAVKHNAI